MGAAQGKKVDPAPLRLRRSRRSRPRARSSQREAVWLAPLRTASSGEDLADIAYPAQEVPGGQAKRKKSRRRKRRLVSPAKSPSRLPASRACQPKPRRLCPAREQFDVWAGACSKPHGPIRRATQATGTRRRLNSGCGQRSATAVLNSAEKAWRSRAGLPGAPFVPRPCRR